jgi:hypothetical protein
VTHCALGGTRDPCFFLCSIDRELLPPTRQPLLHHLHCRTPPPLHVFFVADLRSTPSDPAHPPPTDDAAPSPPCHTTSPPHRQPSTLDGCLSSPATAPNNPRNPNLDPWCRRLALIHLWARRRYPHRPTHPRPPPLLDSGTTLSLHDTACRPDSDSGMVKKPMA